jgi:hypothetical protein
MRGLQVLNIKRPPIHPPQKAPTPSYLSLLKGKIMIYISTLTKLELLKLVNYLALKLSDEVDARSDELIAEGIEFIRQPKTQYKLTLDLGETGSSSLNDTFDEALETFKEFGRRHPGPLFEGRITKVS